jgi:glycosyltransferase involved in cell wall biosynthesis
MEKGRGNIMDIKVQGIRVVAPVFDQSGYGKASRDRIQLLFKSKIPVWIQPISFEKDRPDLGEEGQFLEGLCRTPHPYDINYVRLSPEIAINYMDPSAVNIICFAWETSLLDPHWVDCVNKFDGAIVESAFTKKACLDSGVTIPVFIVHHQVETEIFKPKTEPNLDGVYSFYSIQQWTERKNGLGLLKSYFNAFRYNDNVRLILKTYLSRVEVNIDQGKNIKEDIANLKRSLNLPWDLPPVYLITDKLSDQEIIKMHEDCDCYVLLDRGEGWGLPFAAAAAAGNMVIAPDFGGTREFLNETNSSCVSGQPTYVSNMTWSPYYRGNQLWFDPNLIHAAAAMRLAYENRSAAFEMGQNARKDMELRFNFEMVRTELLKTIAKITARKRSK